MQYDLTPDTPREARQALPVLFSAAGGAALGVGIAALIRGEKLRIWEALIGGLVGAVLGAADAYLRKVDLRNGELRAPTMRVILGVALIGVAVTNVVENPARKVALAVLGGLLISAGIQAAGDQIARPRWIIHHELRNRQQARIAAIQARHLQSRADREVVGVVEGTAPLTGDAVVLLR